MSVDAIASDPAGPTYRVAPRPVYEGQPYYTFDEVVEHFSFWDLLDIINPLQHIPIIGSIYREITGDEIKSYAQVAGSALYGGGIGALAGIATMVVTESTGKEPAQLVLAAFTGDHSTPDTDSGVVGDAENLASTAGPLGHDLLGNTGNAAQAPALAAAPGTAASTNTALAGQTAPGTPALGGAAAAGSVPPGLATSSTPLGALLLASEAGQMAADQAAARGLRETAPVLDGARSAALSAMIAQTNTGGLRPETTTRPGAATLTAMLDGTPRDAIASTTPASTDQQSQDMTHNSSQDPGREQTAYAGAAASRPRTSGETGGRSEMAMPTDIERGRAALRERLSAVQGAERATDRPTGLSLADYRANPNRRAESGSNGPDSARRPRAAVNSLGAADLGRLLPDQATMAGLLERGERAAMAADSRARRLADDAARTATAPETVTPSAPSFRALPIGEANAVKPQTDATDAAAGPVVTQPWFSQRVMDAMQRYDAQRQIDAGAAS